MPNPIRLSLPLLLLLFQSLPTLAQSPSSQAPTPTTTSPSSTITPISCPAAVSTTSICSTCVTAACVVQATITAACGCPSPPETIYSSHPCSLGCSGLGCATVYDVVTEACTGVEGSGSITGTAPPSGVTPPTAPTAPPGGSGATGTGVVATGGAFRAQPFDFGQFRIW